MSDSYHHGVRVLEINQDKPPVFTRDLAIKLENIDRKATRNRSDAEADKRYVKQVAGKELSDENYTRQDKQALAALVVGFPESVSQSNDAADRAEIAAAAAFANADVYPNTAAGYAAVEIGEQFSVVEGEYLIRYKKTAAAAGVKVSKLVLENKARLLTAENLDSFKDEGHYKTLAANATAANGYPLTGHDCAIEIFKAGVYGAFQVVRNVTGDSASRAFRTKWSDWEFTLKSTATPINRGNVDGITLLNTTLEGTYFVTNATDFPVDFGRAAAFFKVTKFGLRYKRELIDQYDYTNRFVQMGAGGWENVTRSVGSGGGGATINVDPNALPNGIAQTDTSSETDVFYNKFGVMAVRQKTYSWMYNASNAAVANGNMLSTVYDFFDALVAEFPSFVNMNLLGTDATGLEIREYVIKPQTINKMASAPASINQFQEIMMFSGQHGQEHTAIVNLMIFCDEMMRNYNSSDLYATLRTSTVLRIMPAMNPWGVKNLNRRNSNGVDLNRNFPSGWEAASGDKGSAPLSENESIVLANWVTANKARSICTINMHDHSDQALTWGTASQGWPEKLLFRSFQRVGKWYHSNFTDPTPEHPVSWLGNPRDGYSDKYISDELGVHALLFECPPVNHPKLGAPQANARLASKQILCEILTLLCLQL